ncbi:A24 family peptidase [Spirulina subsalsa]|uniref:prepilin peptidase n=1 Tax=Spirulina subsalsa TaxID=54311 RepID=UPI00037483C5
MIFWVELIITLFVLVFGAAIGSFLNVVIYRIPAGLSILSPPSRCPHCLHRLGMRENIPVLGWFLLKGRCKHCHAPIAIRYPLLEAITALLLAGVYWQFGLTVQTLGYWVFVSGLLALAFIDLDTFTLPNCLTQPGLLLGLGFAAWVGWQESQTPEGVILSLMGGIVGGVLGIWLLDLIRIVGSMVLGRAAMGAGDGKLAAMMGVWLGWQYLLVAGFLACGLGSIVGGGAIALGWLKRSQPIPFGPFLVLAALLTLFWGEILLSTYLRWFFPLN